MNKLLNFALGLTIAITPLMSSAGPMSVNEPRLLITDKNKRSEFKVFNTSPEVQSIRIRIVEKLMDEDGTIRDIAQSPTSAADYIRVGPRMGRNLGPKDFQKFRLRAKFNKLADGEYRSHLLFESMDTPKEETTPGVHVKPNIRYSIPVIIRKGDLHAQVSIKDVQFGQNKEKQQTIAFNITRDGNRSVYGDLDIYQIVQGQAQLLVSTKGQAIYTDVKQRKYVIPLDSHLSNTEVKIVFREDPDFGGDQTAETIIKV